MTEQERKQLAMHLSALSAYYQRPLADATLLMYVEDLADLPINEVIHAATIYRRNAKNRTMPLPAQLREIVEPVADEDTQARDAASRIIQAIRKDGYSNEARARERIGDLGWAVVQRMGGWALLCETMLDREIPHYQAQFRDLAKTLIIQGRAGLLDTPPALPGRDNVAVINPPTQAEKQRQLAGMIKDLNEAIK